MKKAFITAALIAASMHISLAGVIISGVVDGNETGGTPKAIELVFTANVADASIYSVGRYTNGGSSLTSVTALPSAAFNTGDFFYITGGTSSETILENQGFTVDDSYASLTVASINGDDLIAVVLTSDSSLVDVFGLPGQGDTDFYADSVALRNASSQSPDPIGSLDAASNFTITSWVDEATFGTQFGTFSAIPEPSGLILALLGSAGFLLRRRK